MSRSWEFLRAKGGPAEGAPIVSVQGWPCLITHGPDMDRVWPVVPIEDLAPDHVVGVLENGPSAGHEFDLPNGPTRAFRLGVGSVVEEYWFTSMTQGVAYYRYVHSQPTWQCGHMRLYA